MNQLPAAATYDQEMQYFPWNRTVRTVADIVVREAPRHARVADLMCGTGYVLRQIQESRPDLRMVGVDISEEFIGYVRSLTDGEFFEWEVADILKWKPKGEFQVVLCTAGMHHVPYEWQRLLLWQMDDALSLEPDSFCLLAESCLSASAAPGGMSRKLAAAELGHAYLAETIRLGAPEEVIRAAARLIENDVMQDGEWKLAAAEIAILLKEVFGSYVPIEHGKAWPDDPDSFGYGDYWWKLRREEGYERPLRRFVRRLGRIRRV